eukprot:34663_1
MATASALKATVSVPHLRATPRPLTGRTLVLGGNRGLGLEVVKACVAKGLETIAVCRKSSPELDSTGCKVISGVDLLDPPSIDAAVALLGEEKKQINTLLSIAGVFEPDEWGKVDYKACARMYQVCSLGPLQLFESLTNNTLLGEGSRIGMITSEGGSISLRTENEGGNNYGHHMSKCAQNMMGRLLAWDLKPKGIAIVSIHPGFMKTDMTSHYSSLYESYGAFPASEAVPGILGAVERTSLDNTGEFVSATNHEHFGMGVLAYQDLTEFKQYSPIPF